MTKTVELGIHTFGDVTVDAAGNRLSDAQVLRNVVDQAILADQLGIDFVGLGEHHRDDFAISAPETVLAAIAGQTSRIRLGSAVTVLSSDDPIRVFQRFATLDALSNGRAEFIVGRGSFTESFPLFGYELSQYETLFNEKLDLLATLLQEQPVTWSGSHRAPLHNQDVFPKTESGRIKAWIGVGGSPESVIRSVKYQMPMMLAIIGGAPERFRPFVDLYHQAITQAGVPMMPLGVHSPGHIAETDEQARAELWPHFQLFRDRLGRERGWPPTSQREFESEIEQGSLYVGSPETVARRIASAMTALSLDRFDFKYASGAMPHEQLMTSLTLFGTEVAPRVRELVSASVAA
jgi:probable LLM family oxidoreductase